MISSLAGAGGDHREHAFFGHSVRNSTTTGRSLIAFAFSIAGADLFW